MQTIDTTATIDQIIAAGGRRWTKYGKDRIYMNADALQAIFGGTTRARRTYIGEWAIANGSKVYYDIPTATWVIEDRSNLSDGLADALAAHFAPAVEDDTETAETAADVEATSAAAIEVVAQAEAITRTAALTAHCSDCGRHLTRDDRAMQVVPGMCFDCA